MIFKVENFKYINDKLLSSENSDHVTYLDIFESLK